MSIVALFKIEVPGANSILALICPSFHVHAVFRFRASLVKIAGRGIPTVSPHGNRSSELSAIEDGMLNSRRVERSVVVGSLRHTPTATEPSDRRHPVTRPPFSPRQALRAFR